MVFPLTSLCSLDSHTSSFCTALLLSTGNGFKNRKISIDENKRVGCLNMKNPSAKSYICACGYLYLLAEKPLQQPLPALLTGNVFTQSFARDLDF